MYIQLIPYWQGLLLSIYLLIFKNHNPFRWLEGIFKLKSHEPGKFVTISIFCIVLNINKQHMPPSFFSSHTIVTVKEPSGDLDALQSCMVLCSPEIQVYRIHIIKFYSNWGCWRLLKVLYIDMIIKLEIDGQCSNV